LLAVLFEAHATSDFSEALSAQPDVVLADESLFAPAALAFLELTGSLCGLLACFLFRHSETSTS
jgi:hypothetical protein